MMRGFGFFQQAEGLESFPAGHVFFEEGQPGAEMYVLVAGVVDISLEERLIDRLEAGEIFGEMALVDDRPRSASAVAATDCRVLPLDQTRFAHLVQQHPGFAIQVMTTMSNRTRRLMEEEVQRQRLEEELAIGRQIQLSLLPERCPEIPGWEIAAFYHAARQVGGDLYDFLVTPEDRHRLDVVIADVTGKGVPAALFMAHSRMTFRATADRGLGPAATLQKVNQLLIDDVRTRLFLSAFYASFDTRTGRMCYANAGHEFPLLLRASTGEAQELRTAGLVLGAFRTANVEETAIEVAPGDVLVFYTDGVTEARDAKGQFFGEERLQAALGSHRESSAAGILRGVVDAVAKFAGSTSQSDDFTLVVVKRAQR